MKPSTPKNIWSEWHPPLSTGEPEDLINRLLGKVHRLHMHAYLGESHKLDVGEGGVFVLTQGQIGGQAETRRKEALAVEDEIKKVFVGGRADFVAQPGTLDTADLSLAISNQTAVLTFLSERVSQVESALKDAVKGIEQLQAQQSSVWVPIESFAPEPYEVLKPFTVVVRPDGEEFEASFFDANLYGAGDNEEEAISDLKAVVIESFARLSELGDDKLGPAMIKQKRVLAAHIRRIT